jgi:hypothetical protein
MSVIDHQFLLNAIGQDKESFLENLRQKIEREVASKSPGECIEIITISPSGHKVTWKYTDGFPFFQRFWSFIREKNYVENGVSYQLDSGLTQPILEVVTEHFQELMLKHQDSIIDFVVLEMVSKDQMRDVLLRELVKKNPVVKMVGSASKQLLKDMLIQGVQEKLQASGSQVASELANNASSALSSGFIGGIATKTALIAAKAAASGVGSIVIAKISVVLVKSLVPMLAKLLAKPAVAMMLKKFVVFAVISSTAKMILAKFGLSLSTGILVILAPVVIAWIIKDINAFPQKLGEDLGNTITAEIGSEFEDSLDSIIGDLIIDFTSDKMMEQIAKSLLEDSTTVDLLVQTLNDRY